MYILYYKSKVVYKCILYYLIFYTYIKAKTQTQQN